MGARWTAEKEVRTLQPTAKSMAEAPFFNQEAELTTRTGQPRAGDDLVLLPRDGATLHLVQYDARWEGTAPSRGPVSGRNSSSPRPAPAAPRTTATAAWAAATTTTAQFVCGSAPMKAREAARVATGLCLARWPVLVRRSCSALCVAVRVVVVGVRCQRGHAPAQA